MSLPTAAPDRHLGGDVAGDALAHRAQPLLDQAVGVLGTVCALVDRHPDVGGHPEHLFEPFLLVEGLGEAEAGPGDAGQGLAPAEELLGGGDGIHLTDATCCQPSTAPIGQNGVWP